MPCVMEMRTDLPSRAWATPSSRSSATYGAHACVLAIRPPMPMRGLSAAGSRRDTASTASRTPATSPGGITESRTHQPSTATRRIDSSTLTRGMLSLACSARGRLNARTVARPAKPSARVPQSRMRGLARYGHADAQYGIHCSCAVYLSTIAATEDEALRAMWLAVALAILGTSVASAETAQGDCRDRPEIHGASHRGGREQSTAALRHRLPCR